MMRDAEAHADEAGRMRELADAKNQAETLVYATEKSLREHRDAVDADTVSTIESRLEEVKQALDGDDAAQIRTKSEELMEASHKLAQAVYEKVQAEQAASASTGGDGVGASDDEVVEEADYEVIDEEAKQS